MMQNDNVEVCDGFVVVKVNSKIYPLEVIYSAAYVFLDRAYVILDGDLDKYVLVNLKLKSEGDLKRLGLDFFNELINYSDYTLRSKNTIKIREMILQRAIITNDSSLAENVFESDDELDDELDEELDDEFDDPEGIAVPWEEKYGGKDDS